jgi:hypothetical protein
MTGRHSASHPSQQPSELHHPIRTRTVKNCTLAGRTQLIPGPGPSALRGMTLLHGGERQCEPIYEDICNIGSWDKDHEERVLLWVGDES